MLDAQHLKFKMFMLTRQNFEDNKPIWENLPYIATRVAKLKSIIVDLEAAMAIQGVNKKGWAADKKTMRGEMVKSALLVIAILKSYAAFAGNKLLRQQVHFTPSMFQTASGGNALVAAGAVLNLAIEHKAGAASFGLTQAFIDTLLAKKTAFADFITAPADQKKIKIEATAAIKRLFAEGDELLKEGLDNDLEIFQDTERDFYLMYKRGRRIGDSITIKLAMRCTVTDAVTKQVIPGARVVIKDHNIKRKTTPKGQILVRNLREGNHTVTVTMDGYVTQAVKAKHTAGETTFVMVEMVRVE